MIRAAIALRAAAGFGLRAWGADGFTQGRPFTAYLPDAERRDAQRAALERHGFTVEPIQ